MNYTARVLALLMTLTPCASLAQGVVVAPHAVYIDHASRAGSITLYNPGAEPVEVSISFGFGYPTTDSAGTVGLELMAEAPPGEPSAMAWIQAFPRRVTITQQQRQTIRLLASPPAGLPDGEYWARLIVAAKGGQVPVVGVPDSNEVRVGLTLEVRTVLAVVYRKGALTTGITLAPVSASYDADTVSVRVPMSRTGTAAYLGTARVDLVDGAGKEVAGAERAVGVYYTLDPRLELPVDSLPAGTYKVRVSVSTDRPDLAPRTALPAPTVRDSVEVTIK
jgi:P pilus assembly chaperone PapD